MTTLEIILLLIIFVMIILFCQILLIISKRFNNIESQQSQQWQAIKSLFDERDKIIEYIKEVKK